MKRDMDLIRRIALETAELEAGHIMVGIEDVEPWAFAEHVTWMQEAGLLDAAVARFESQGDPPMVKVRRLTWEGCEFVDAVRSDTLWKKAKESVIKPAASFSFNLLREWLTAELRNGFPTLR